MIAYAQLCLNLPNFSCTKHCLQELNIAIIGGGVSGLTTARIFKSQGLNFTLFEATDSVSGVWSAGYPNFAIQTPGKLYEFPDKELEAPKDFKDGLMIKKYCEDYVEENDLSSSIKLNIKVTSIERAGNKWMLQLEKDGETRKKAFDYVVLATGIYSPNLKHVPDVKDLKFFQGHVYHSEETAHIQDRLEKKVLVVGEWKNA
jgi:dimethylaniline monooxygenase (N-oxide forming)